MERYKQILIEKIEILKNSKSSFAKTRLVILLQLLGELENNITI